MRKLGLLLWMLAFTAVGAQAQNIIKSLERTVPGQGKVTIHQDPKIEALIGVERPSMGEQKVLKAAGFRIQAYAGNNTREAKVNPPRWLWRVGDFRSIEEADAMMRKLKATGVFKEVSIVKDQINIPL